jgi:Family of unknown function (DUF5706)
MTLSDTLPPATTPGPAPADPENPTGMPAMLVPPPVMDRLRAWAEQVQGDIAHADTKASTLLGAVALVATVMVSLGTRLPAGRSGAGLLGLTGLSCLAGCVVALLLVIRPRLGGGALGGHSFNTEDRGFIAFAHLTPEQLLAAACADSAPDADPTQAIRRTQVLSRIALAKNELLRLAVVLLLVSMPLIAAGFTGGAR